MAEPTVDLDDPDASPGATLRSSVVPAGLVEVVEQLLVADDTGDLTLGATLGAGGMGVVRAANQRRLAREVAVKSLRTDDPSAVTALLAEAWVIGRLEHPNIVPIYDISLDAERRPRLVMKKISGVEWAALLDDPAEVERRAGSDDVLGWHLGVLLTVCNAVAFAHSRGILHRDLKPENVMVGAYGEVFVVDWGLAVSLRDDDPDLPLAREQTRPAGTPAYMAPEMIAGIGGLLGVHTDIYLLGGMLFRIVAGRPPRTGATLEELMRRIAAETPEIDPRWPLADVIARALDPDPLQRHRTVQDLQRDIRDWLSHRDAVALLASGQQRVLDLCAAVDDGDPERVREIYTEAQFALRTVRDRWPEAPGLHETVAEDVEVRARFELVRGDVGLATELLAGLPDPPEELREAIDTLRREVEREASELADWRRDTDPRTGWIPRLVGGGVLAAGWVAVPVGSLLLGVDKGYPRELGISATALVVTLLIVGVFFPWYFRSQVSRTLFSLLVLMRVFSLVFLTSAWLAGLPAELAGALETNVFFITLTLAAALVERRLAFAVPFYLVAVLWGVAHPDLSLRALGAANLVVALNTGWVLAFPRRLAG
ncbi:MAG: serine/threonine protein kinase [Myxococcales bacterium]|nr:serine/threonine protein kinase [Myxococcales bacterium]